jgi:hypothetical protein
MITRSLNGKDLSDDELGELSHFISILSLKSDAELIPLEIYINKTLTIQSRLYEYKIRKT